MDTPFYIGCHLSSAKGYFAMGKQAMALGGNTFQFFTRNPRGSAVKPLDEADIAAFRDFWEANSFGPIVAHAPYTLNACAAQDNTQRFAAKVMREDLERLELLPQVYYNFHPGSHVKQGAAVGIAKISDLLNRILTDHSPMVLLETMAGKGTEVGRSFEELAAIIERLEQPQKAGVCLDTCHVFDGGYDIVHDLDGVLKTFDDIIGLEKLKAVHLNDSKNPLGSHKDRHEKIAEGSIGLEAMAHIINHPRLRALPFLLETPNELEGYGREITLLKSMRKEVVI